MKKGLLSVLAFAMILVGCQSYDDQFDSLNDQISALSTQLSGTEAAVAAQSTAFANQIAGLQAQLDGLTSSLADDIAALEAQGDALSAALDAQGASTTAALEANAAAASEQASTTAAALAANAAAIAANAAALSDQGSSTAAALEANATALAANAEQIAAIQAALDNAVTSDDLNPLQEDIDQLLEQTAVADGPIRLTSLSELEYVQELGDFTRIRGGFTVDVTNKDLRDSIVAVNTILKRIRIITGGNLTLTGHASVTHLDASGLTYVDGTLTVTEQPAMLGSLTSVEEDLILNYDGGYDLPGLIGVRNIALTDKDSTTMVNFPDIVATGNLGNSSGSSVATFKVATSVVLGDINVTSLTADKATTVTLGYDGETTGGTTISAKAADSIMVSFLGKEADNITITGSAASTVNASKLKAGYDVNITGGTVNMDALATVSGTLTISEATAVSLPALTSVQSITTMNDATSVLAPKWAVTVSATFNEATTIAIKSGSDSLTVTDEVETLTIGALANGATFNANDFSVLQTLDITGVKAATAGAGAQSNKVRATGTGSGGATLKTLTVGGYLGGLYLDSTPVASINTSGNIIDVEVTGNNSLKTIVFGHTYVPTDNAPTITITENKNLTSVDMQSVARVKTLTVSGNLGLTSISVGTSDTANLATPSTAVSYTIVNNDLSGTYTAAVAETQANPYVAPTIVQKDLAALKAILLEYMAQSTRSASVTYNLNFDEDGDSATGAASSTLAYKLDQDTNAQVGENGNNESGTGDDDSDNGVSTSGTVSGTGSGINTARELALLSGS